MNGRVTNKAPRHNDEVGGKLKQGKEFQHHPPRWPGQIGVCDGPPLYGWARIL
jgi:hypothetical protein